MILSVPGDSGIKGRTASITEQLSQVRQYSVCLSDEAFVIETFNATYHANCFVIESVRNLSVVALHKCLILGQVLNILARVLQWHCCMFLLKFIFPATTDTFKPVSFPSLPPSLIL